MNNLFSFHIQRYFMTFLIKQHNYGQNTISSYRDTFRLLLMFIAESRPKLSALTIDEISYDLESQNYILHIVNLWSVAQCNPENCRNSNQR